MSKAADLASLASASETALSNRNIVINGAMQISQRATSVTGIGANGGAYHTLDRIDMFFDATAGRLTMSQAADGPSGFANCLKLDCTTADASIAAAEVAILQYAFEGQDLQQLKKGTSDAEKVTVSFYVKGNANATYTLELQDNDNSRHIAQTFNVTTDWNRIELTFVGDTSDPLDDDNAASLRIQIYLQAGSTYTGGTFTSNTWADITNGNTVKSDQTMFFDSTNRELFLTGLQMEIGTVATPFEHRSFGQDLASCQRYYEKSYDQGDVPGTGTHYGAIKIGGSNVSATTSYISGGGNTFKVTKRARPTVVVYDPDGGTTNQCQRWQLGVGNYNNQASVSADISETNFLQYSATGNSASGVIYHYTADAEL